MANLKVSRESRAAASKFDVLEPEEGAEEIHFDGYAGFALGAGVVKVGLFTVIGVKQEGDDQIEQRLVKLRLTMPIVPFAEMCLHSLVNIKANQSIINEMYDESKDKINTLVENIGAPASKSRGKT